MRRLGSRALFLSAAGALLWLNGCGRDPVASARTAYEPPFRGAPLVGRWVGGSPKVVLELLDDGTFVELREREGQRSTRLPDGTFRTETVPAYQCFLGTFSLTDGESMRYDLTEVASIGRRQGTCTWRVDPGGRSLSLSGGEPDDLLGR